LDTDVAIRALLTFNVSFTVCSWAANKKLQHRVIFHSVRRQDRLIFIPGERKYAENTWNEVGQ
jgi:hypothetical protein